MLRAYRNHRLRSKTKGGGNVNVGTVNREMNTLRAMLNEAKINDWIMVNPFSKARPGELINTADEQPRETILTYEEEQRLLKECEGEDRRHLKALVIAGLDTGARKGELLRLTWPQIDFEKNVIRALISYKGKNGAQLKRDAVLVLRLSKVDGTVLRELRVPGVDGDWSEMFDLPAGSYTLSVANHSTWVCQLIIRST
jgi:integrase